MKWVWDISSLGTLPENRTDLIYHCNVCDSDMKIFKRIWMEKTEK